MLGERSRIGKKLAPLPFLLFCALAVAGGAVACPLFGWVRGTMSAFDVASMTFIVLILPLFRYKAEQMRAGAQRNDANRGMLLLIAALVTGVILVAVAAELLQKGRPKPIDMALVVMTLTLAWIFGTLVYALHYAHLYYSADDDGSDAGGIKFPETEEPNYWDFLYFSTCLAMTFQTADVDITDGKFRKVAMVHTIGSFIFNIGIIAFSINILGAG